MPALPVQPLTIYLDESGDLGFSQDSSTYLTLACISTSSTRALKRAVRNLKESVGYSRRVEFKATKDKWQVRQRLLSLVPALCLEIRAISVYKPHVFPSLRANVNALYNYVAGLLLVPYLRHLTAARLVIDRRELKVAKLPFQLDAYLAFRLECEENAQVQLSITHGDSFVSPGVQVADAVANAIWRSLERNDSAAYELIAPCLRDHRVLFAPKSK
jgi:hypothetical protein